MAIVSFVRRWMWIALLATCYWSRSSLVRYIFLMGGEWLFRRMKWTASYRIRSWLIIIRRPSPSWRMSLPPWRTKIWMLLTSYSWIYLYCWWLDVHFPWFSLYNPTILEDPVMKYHMNNIKNQIFEQLLLKVVEPFSVVYIDYIANIMKQSKEEVCSSSFSLCCRLKPSCLKWFWTRNCMVLLIKRLKHSFIAPPKGKTYVFFFFSHSLETCWICECLC